jgi:hypothetical protein
LQSAASKNLIASAAIPLTEHSAAQHRSTLADLLEGAAQ